MNKSAITIITILSACYLLLPVSTANAASFDCVKASTWTEKTICSNTELSKLDEVMAHQYKAKLVSAFDYEDSSVYKISIRNEQRNWLKFQRNSCKSTECLIREYKERIGKNNRSYRSDLNRSKLPTKQAFGEFYEDVKITMYDPDTKVWSEATSTTNSIYINSVVNKPYMAIVESEMIFTNGHTCDIGDEVAVWTENHWAIRSNQYKDKAELRLYPMTYKGQTQLLLRDIDNNYRENHCGMRGYFDGKKFALK